MRRRGAEHLGRPGRAGLWTHLRINPAVPIVLIAVAAAFFPLRRAITSFVFWHYRATYQQVDFVMGEPDDNAGYPLVRGTLEPGGEAWLMSADRTPAGYVLASDRSVVIAPGRRVRVWWSEAAPVIGFPSGSTKIMPVSTMPQLPGLLRILAWLGASLVTLLAGLWLAARPIFRSRTWRSETLYDEKSPPKP